MEVLTFGVSRIVVKRVLPALVGLSKVRRIHLASRRDIDPAIVPAKKRGQVFRGYEEGLARCSGGIAYVSLPNSLHEEWVGKALEAGWHVVVDKPAFTTPGVAARMVALAQRRRLCLAEASVWNYHPQIEAIRHAFAEAGESPVRIVATFSFPPLSRSDFRYAADMGGGSLFDLGPYAVSCGRVFFSSPPSNFACRTHGLHEAGGVDIAFSVLASYAGGESLVGHFGFTTEYRNSLTVLGAGLWVEIDRAFTVPPDLIVTLRFRRRNQESCVQIPAADSFQAFLQDVIEGIELGKWQRFTDALEVDAGGLERLRASAERHKHAH